MSKEVNVKLRGLSQEVLKNYPLNGLTKEAFEENEDSVMAIQINEVLRDYNNLVDIAEKELVSVFNEDEMNQLYNVFNGILYTSEITAKSFLYHNVVDSGSVSGVVVDKITKLSNTQAYVVLRKVYKFWQE